MKKKYLKFLKNVGLSAAAAVTGGVAGAELSDLLTDSKAVISASSTLSQYVAALGVFFPLHAHDNPDLYREENNKFKWKTYLKDMTKMTLGFGVLDYLYLVGRPVAHYYLQKQGYDPATASLLSDAFCMSSYYALAIPVAKGLNIIREENKPNKNEDEMKTITDFVEKYRKEKKITPTPGIKFELSCTAFGEGYNLLYTQLVYTTNGYGSWQELKDEEVRKLVLDQIKKDSKKI